MYNTQTNWQILYGLNKHRGNRTPWMQLYVFTEVASQLSGYLHAFCIFVVNPAQSSGKSKVKVMWCIYIAPLSLTSQIKGALQWSIYPQWTGSIYRRKLQPLLQSMHAGTRFTDLGRMESWVNFSGKEGRQIFQSRQNREWNPGP